MIRLFFKKNTVLAMVLISAIMFLSFAVSAQGTDTTEGVTQDTQQTVTENSTDETQNEDVEQGRVQYLTLEYDDVLDLNILFSNYVVINIENVSVNSYKVENGLCTQTKDEDVVSIYAEDSTSVIATGIGNARVDIVKRNEVSLYDEKKASSLITLDITVVPATLTVVYAAGQSNMEGTCYGGVYYPQDSVMCDRTEVYSAYAPSSDLRGQQFTGISEIVSSRYHEEDYIPGNISNRENVKSLGGEELVYPLYSLSSDGLGKTGPDSGFAYEWNRLTDDKVFIVNSAFAGTSINYWKTDTFVYQHAVNAFTNAEKTYEAEIASGHFEEGKRILLWMQGESDGGFSTQIYRQGFDLFLSNIKSDIKFDCTGIILPRAIFHTLPEDRTQMLQLWGFRNYQGYITRQENDVFMLSTVNEKWVTDADVNEYFTEKYGNMVDYPLRDNTTIKALPTTSAEVNDGIHYCQICHNENGIDAADNLYYAFDEDADASEYYWIDQSGKRVETDDVITVGAEETFALSLRADLSSKVKGITFSLDENYIEQIEGEDTFKALRLGETKIGVYRGSELLFEQAVKIIYGTPVVTLVENEAEGIRITWNEAGGDPYCYKVFIKNGTGWKMIGSTEDTSFFWTGAVFNTKYTFTVRCADENGNYVSDFNRTGWTVTHLLDTPVISSVKAASDSVNISWDKVAGAQYYRVFVKNGSGWKAIGNVSGTSFSWKDAVLGNNYTFTVRCTDKSGKYVSNYDKTGVTLSYWLDTPVISSVKGTSSSVNISWNKVSGAQRYRVFIKNGSSWKTIATTTAVSYNWTDAVPGCEYVFTVRAADKDGKYVSLYDKTGYTYKYYFDTPVLKSAVMSGGDIKITWDAVSGANRYRVFYKGGTQTSWKTLANTTALSYVFNQGVYNTEYIFTVRCVSDKGAFLSDYDKNGIKCVSAVEMPQISSVKASGTSVVISWNAVEGAGSYRLYYKNGNGWKGITTTTATSYTFKDVEIYKTYFYTVRCLNSKGNYVSSYDTNGREFTLKLNTPVLLSVEKASSSSATLTWKAVSCAEKYRVFYKIPGQSGWTGIGNTASTTYLIKGMEAGQTYTFTVRCINSSGNKYMSDYKQKGITIEM